MTTTAAIVTLAIRAIIVTALLLITIAAIAALPELMATIARLFHDREDGR